MSDQPMTGKELSFEATLENWAEGLDYCAVAVPEAVTKALGTHGPVAVRARLNDSKPFQVSLFPVGGGRHFIRIRAQVRKETRTAAGDRVRLQFTVLDRAATACPPDLQAALESHGATERFEALPPGKRSFVIRRIEEAVKPETRRRRITDAVAELRASAG